MIIRNITLRNFQCYYGSHSLDFDKGLNVVIGTGGKGKSKLFNAFYWVLFGKIYITDLGWCSTDSLPASAKMLMRKHGFFNMKALSETAVNDSVIVSVLLEMSDDKGNNIQIERTASAKRLDGADWTQEQAWNVSPASLKVSYETAMGTKPLYGIMAENKIDELFPVGIRNYIWFQGESLDELINFRDKETLKAAVKHISYYPYYEKLSEIIRIAQGKIQTMETKQLKAVNGTKSNVKRLLQTIESARIKIEMEERNQKELEGNIICIKAALSDSEQKMSGMAAFTKLVRDYKDCEQEILRLQTEIGQIDQYQREKLPELWVLRGIKNMLLQSKEYIAKHTEEELTLPEKKYLDEPGRSKLEEILRTGKCFVCGSDVTDGTTAHQWILNRIHAQENFYREMEEYKSNLSFSKEFSMFVGKIADYPTELLLSVENIDKQFEKSEEQIEKLQARKNKLLEKKAELDKKMEEMKRKTGVNPIKQVEDVDRINSTIRCSRSELEKQQRRLDSCKTAIRDYNAELRDAENEYARLSAKDSSIGKVAETEWKNISTFLQDICQRVRDNARKDLLHKIQSRANDYYRHFTEHDKGYTGSVVINEDYSIDFDSGLNTSHEDRKKISIINALLSLNQEAVGVFYPFISDAPTSNFDPVSSIYYMMGIKDIFEQSIIVTKDLVPGTDEYEQLISGSNIGRVYELQSQLYCPEHINPGLHEVSTIIKPLK